jgi:hypothetical protein
MKNSVLLALSILVLLTAGCGAPQTAEEFRKMIAPEPPMAKVVNLEVDRPFSEVTASFKKMAPQCLDKRIKTTSTRANRYGGQTSVVVSDYTPTVVSNDNKTEVHVQMKYVSGVKSIGKEPEKGNYLLVADAEPAGKDKTKVTIYSVSVYKKLIAAVENWSKGDHLCPDLTR